MGDSINNVMAGAVQIDTSTGVGLADKRFCENCGALISDGASFCDECGAPVPVDDTKCSSCGYVFERPGKFCPKCGTKRS